VIYILDTDVFTLCELPDSPEYSRLHTRALVLNEDDRVVTSIVTYEEQTRGWLAYAAKSRATSHQIKAYRLLKKHLETYQNFDVLDFDERAAKVFDELRAAKRKIGTSDLKIAAITMAHDAVLLTRNVVDFKGIPSLRVEDWTR
jgi:tRNA(fMet)-specific endonuclease VapC